MALVPSVIPELQNWLLTARRVEDGGRSLMGDLVERVRAKGVPLWRCSFSLHTMHPELVWRNVQWNDVDGVTVIERPYSLMLDRYFTESPVAALRKGETTIRVHLDRDEPRFPICRDLQALGGTDYHAQGLPFSNGEVSYVSWATRAPGGFADDAIRTLDELLPFLAQRIELESAYHGSRALLAVYLGDNAARRVLAGAFRRGHGETIDAAIWYCDLRDFTGMSDRIPSQTVVQVLDAYFDRVAGAVIAHGGEVLKFVGDAVLAIFPVADDPRVACQRALHAARDALDALAQLNVERVAASEPPLAIGVALHVGQVMYGNIGTRTRLDFTVISSSVNETCRLEALCKPLNTPLALSEAFVKAVHAENVRDLGEHALKGVKTPIRVFTLEQ